MKKELDDKLVEKYPKIFRYRHSSMLSTCMCWGFEHGDGWYWLIDNLCDSIQSYIDNNSVKRRIKNKYIRYIVDTSRKIRYKLLYKNSFISKNIRKLLLKMNDMIEKRCEFERYETIPQVHASQVKEKLGGLRFYYDGGDNTIDGMVWLAEHMSDHICEECGSTKDIGRTSGWISTLCKHCAKGKQNWKQLH